MPDATGARHSPRILGQHRAKRPLVKSVRLWLPIGVFVVLAAVVVVALWVGTRALDAKRDLEAALPLASKAQQQILSGDSAGAASTAAELQSKTAAARSAASGRVWRAVEWVPVAGPNLKAVRLLANAVDGLARNAVVPASKINLDAFKPVNGRIDVKAVSGLSGTITTAQKALSAAQASVDSIDRSGLIGQVDSAVTKLDTTLTKANGLVSGVDGIVKILPAALGGDGPRHYLIMFQGNSEVRALGGGPAALALLTVNDGSIKLTKQYMGVDFVNARPEPIIPLDPAVTRVYSDIVGRWTANGTAVANFPTAAAIMSAYWAEKDSTHIDGVLSIDPVALGYLLNATGPVKLVTGQTLTGANAAPLILNQVYALYPDPRVQDAFFEAAIGSIFSALTSGQGSPQSIAKELTRAANEGRLLYWSKNKAENAIVAGTRISGVLPSANDKSTVIGAYFNDTTSAKIDYYAKASVTTTSTQCQSGTPTFIESVTLTNTIDPSKASTLPDYVSGAGKYFAVGKMSTDVVVYGPVGAKITAWKGTRAAKLMGSGVIDGRPASRINVVLAPGQSVTFTYTMAGAKGKYGPLEVQTTPMVWPTPTSVSTPGCGAKK